MACDPNTLISQSRCFECFLTGNMAAAVEIVMLCAIRDGETVSTDPQTLAAQASCIQACIPIGMLPAVKLSLLCDIANQ
jgi:hypothetical protein